MVYTVNISNAKNNVVPTENVYLSELRESIYNNTYKSIECYDEYSDVFNFHWSYIWQKIKDSNGQLNFKSVFKKINNYIYELDYPDINAEINNNIDSILVNMDIQGIKALALYIFKKTNIRTKLNYIRTISPVIELQY